MILEYGESLILAIHSHNLLLELLEFFNDLMI